MQYGARPLRSTRRLSNLMGQRPGWYSITNAADASLPTQVSIYDEIGFFGVSAGDFLADLKGISGDIQVSINSPGGDVFDGIAIYNQLKQRSGIVAVIIDGLAASAASFIAMAASPGRLEIAPHAQMMIHNGFSMAIGDAADLRQTADLLDKITTEIASIYAERSGKPVATWLAAMAAETWYSDQEAVDAGLADNIHGQAAPASASDSWDLSVYARAGVIVNADGNHAPMTGTHAHSHPAYGAQGSDSMHSHEHAHDGDANHGHSHAAPAGDVTPPADAAAAGIRNDGAAPVAEPADAPADLGDGWVQDPDGTIRFDPDGDGDDDSTPEGDTDHDYFDATGKQIKPVPPRPEPAPDGGGSIGNTAPRLSDLFPVLFGDVDHSDWDGSKAMANGAAADDPARFYAGICAGRKAGDPDNQDSWALPYKYHPGDPPNAAGVANALARLPQTKGLTNADEAKATLQKAMKQVNPDYDPDAKAAPFADPAVVASAFTLPEPAVDDSSWNPAAALALAAGAADPAAFYRGICAGRRAGDPASANAWALPYRYTPSSPPNAKGVREALAELSSRTDLANHEQARSVLEKALKAINPDLAPDEDIDPGLLEAAFALGLKGAGQ